MGKTLKVRVLISISLISFIWVAASFAAEPGPGSRPPLQSGMTLSQVEALWGAPADKVEFELKRESRWSYPELRKFPAAQLRFVDGALVWNQQSAPVEMARQLRTGSRPQVELQKGDKAAPRSFMALESKKILDEILQEVPSEPEGAPGAPPGGAVSPAQ